MCRRTLKESIFSREKRCFTLFPHLKKSTRTKLGSVQGVVEQKIEDGRALAYSEIGDAARAKSGFRCFGKLIVLRMRMRNGGLERIGG
jgi:hypothetical protein